MDEEPTYEELLAKITDDKQLQFLENYHMFGRITSTAEAIGVTRQTVWNWQQNEGKAFLVAFDSLKKQYDTDLLLRHERNIDDIAFDKEASDKSRVLASIFITKALAPSKYREAVQAIPFTGTIKVELSVPRPGQIEESKPEQLRERNDTIKEEE